MNQKLDLKVQKLDLKVQKLDLKAQKLDLKAQKLDFSAFQLSGVGWFRAQKKAWSCTLQKPKCYEIPFIQHYAAKFEHIPMFGRGIG